MLKMKNLLVEAPEDVTADIEKAQTLYDDWHKFLEIIEYRDNAIYAAYGS